METVSKKESKTIVPIAKGLSGVVTVPGDKSISHRAALLGALSKEGMSLSNFSTGADCLATLECLTLLGFDVERRRTCVRIRKGSGPVEPLKPLDAKNSGTTSRLLTGLLSAMPGLFSVITGDESLTRRPMDRVVSPLRALGAKIDGREGGGRLPLAIRGLPLTGGTCTLPLASAQVKSALILAGLCSRGSVTVVEPLATRDHTEILLEFLKVPIRREGGLVTVYPLDDIPGGSWRIPGDFSAGSFWIGAAAICSGSSLFLPGLGLNPTRTGFLSALQKMGAHFEVKEPSRSGGEAIGTLCVNFAPLKGIRIGQEDIPGMIDELPILAVVATQAEGVTEVCGAQELRVKESDRIAAVAQELRSLGADIEERPDGWRIQGPVRLSGGKVRSHGDHRLAMSLAIAGLVAKSPVEIEGTDCVRISYPSFFRDLEKLIKGPR